jgi:hypothetical protein
VLGIHIPCAHDEAATPEEKFVRKWVRRWFAIGPVRRLPEPHAVVAGRNGGKMRARNLSANELSRIGYLSALAKGET